MKILFWRRKKALTPAQAYKGIGVKCLKHPHTCRCLCNRCIVCIEEETGMGTGSLTYGGEPDSGMIMCNDCLNSNSDEELAEHYVDFSTTYWRKPVAYEVVLATLIKKPSHSTIRRYYEGGKYITEVTDLTTGSVTKSWTEN